MITALYRLLDLLCRFGSAGARQRLRTSHSARRGGRAQPARARRSDPRSARPHLRAVTGDAGMTTAEYAVGTVAAVAFAVVLFKVVQSPAVHSALAAIVTGALHVRM